MTYQSADNDSRLLGFSEHYDENDKATWTREDFLARAEFVNCVWHKGCELEGDPELDGLCPAHFDACERVEHCDAQNGGAK